MWMPRKVRLEKEAILARTGNEEVISAQQYVKHSTKRVSARACRNTDAR